MIQIKLSHSPQVPSQTPQCSTPGSAGWCNCGVRKRDESVDCERREGAMVPDPRYVEPLEHSTYKAAARLVTVDQGQEPNKHRPWSTPDSRYVLGPLAVQGLCSLLQLVQLVLDLFGLVLIPQVLSHGLHTERCMRFWLWLALYQMSSSFQHRQDISYDEQMGGGVKE